MSHSFVLEQLISKETSDCVIVSEKAQKCKATTKVADIFLDTHSTLGGLCLRTRLLALLLALLRKCGTKYVSSVLTLACALLRTLFRYSLDALVEKLFFVGAFTDQEQPDDSKRPLTRPGS
jgi:hypothetical protein